MSGARETIPAAEIAIACTADAAFVMPLAAMLHSLARTLDRATRATVYVIDNGVPVADQKRLTGLCAELDLELRWLDPPTTRLADLPTWGRMPATTYNRLLLGELLPAELERVIWLDCDLLVLTDLTRLWQTPVEDAVALAVRDTIVPLISSRGGVKRWRELGLDRGAPYFNAGVMLIDLVRWREHEIGSKSLAYLGAHHRDVVFWDQDALNAVLAGRWQRLDERWNQNANVVGRALPTAHLGEEHRRLLADDPWIVHFSGRVKPWATSRPGLASRQLWFDHLDQTPWAGWRPRRTLASELLGLYEGSHVRRLVYPAEAPLLLLIRRRRPRIGRR